VLGGPSPARAGHADLRQPRHRLLGTADALARAGRGDEDRARHGMSENDSEDPIDLKALPFPESLCHRCAAPPKYVKTKTSTFIMCPVLPNKYPRQPVVSCSAFTPRRGS